MRTARIIACASALAVTGGMRVEHVSAQSRCGWSTTAEADRLPADVEAIIAQISATIDTKEVVANLKQWHHQCDAGAGTRAVFDLNRLVDRNRKDVALSALLGTALIHGPEVQVEGATGVTNRAIYHLSNSERDGARLLAAAAKDPRFASTALDLAGVALGTRHDATVKVARDALKSVTDRTPSAEHFRLAAELALVAKQYDVALKNAERAIELGSRAAGHAAGIARLMTSSDSTAAATYFSGMVDPGAIALYYDDVSYLLQGDDTLAWQTTPPTERAEWIRKQWQWRAATSSLSLAERLKLHFTRVAAAWDLYPRTVFRSSGSNNAVVRDARLRRMSIDDRGLIYVRHGAPSEVIRMASTSLDNTRIAWGYNGLADGRALFEFTKMDCPVLVPPPASAPFESRNNTAEARSRQRAGGQLAAPQPKQQQFESTRCVNSGDYYLASPIPCQLVSNTLAQSTFLDYGTALARYDPGKASTMTACYTLAVNGNVDELDMIRLHDAELRSESRIQGMTALRTETAGPQLTAPLSTILRTYAMRAGSETKLFAFAAIDGGEIRPKTGTSAYALRLMLSVENAARLTAENVDTTLSFTTQAPLRAGQLARSSIAATASPATDAIVRFTVRNENDAAQGQIVTTARAIPDYSGNRFALSDLIVAEPRDGNFVRGPMRLAPAPGHYVAQGAEFRLFHEVYGAQDNDSLQIRITIAPGDDPSILQQLKNLISRKSAVEVGFAERIVVESGVGRVIHDIGADLQPGRYIISVNVQNGRTGAVAEARTDLIVVKP